MYIYDVPRWFFLKWGMFQTDKIKNVLRLIIFFRKSRRL